MYGNPDCRIGIPGNISNLESKRKYSIDILTTSWEPLPTLDITDRDPDIIYHVEICKTTCGQRVPMSNENVTESSVNNTLDLMEIYRTTVTPRNNVPGYINGHSVAMQGRLMYVKNILCPCNLKSKL